MKTPSKLSTWFLAFYFLFVGLAAFGVFSAPGWLIGALALAAAITLFLDR